jgi:hypothetical protein
MHDGASGAFERPVCGGPGRQLIKASRTAAS